MITTQSINSFNAHITLNAIHYHPNKRNMGSTQLNEKYNQLVESVILNLFEEIKNIIL